MAWLISSVLWIWFLPFIPSVKLSSIKNGTSSNSHCSFAKPGCPGQGHLESKQSENITITSGLSFWAFAAHMGLQSEDLQFWHMLHVVLSAVLQRSPCFIQVMKKSLNQLITSLAKNKGGRGKHWQSTHCCRKSCITHNVCWSKSKQWSEFLRPT